MMQKFCPFVGINPPCNDCMVAIKEREGNEVFCGLHLNFFNGNDWAGDYYMTNFIEKTFAEEEQ